MLKYRFLTALILIPLAVLGIFCLSVENFRGISSIVFLAAGWEWANLIGLRTVFQRMSYVLGCALIMLILFLTWHVLAVQTILIAACIVWTSLFYFMIRPGQLKYFWRQGLVLRGVLGWLLIIGSWYGLNIIFQQNYGHVQILFLLLLVWAADTGAYFVGRKWGKHKLAPQISPGKSVEGLVGGAVLSFLVAVIGVVYHRHILGGSFALLWMAPLIALYSVLGDLFESLIKRNAGVKDSGRLLPGHGGVLDRIDSLLSTAPVFALYLVLTLH